jgi:hypothetical protein
MARTPDDEDDYDGPDPGEECGRWQNGRLISSCSKAGSEECDFECPYRDSPLPPSSTRVKA